MAEKTLGVRQKQKYDTSANWTTNNPILLAGEIGIESDTSKIKIGDGLTAWNNLEYFSGSGVDLSGYVKSTETATGEEGESLKTELTNSGENFMAVSGVTTEVEGEEQVVNYGAVMTGSKTAALITEDSETEAVSQTYVTPELVDITSGGDMTVNVAGDAMHTVAGTLGASAENILFNVDGNFKVNNKDVATTDNIPQISSCKAIAIQDYFDIDYVSGPTFIFKNYCSRFADLNVGDKVLLMAKIYRTTTNTNLLTLMTYVCTITADSGSTFTVSSQFQQVNGSYGSGTYRTFAYLSEVPTDAEKSAWNAKQDAINDLATIRSGASAGATAVQDTNYVHTDNNYTDEDKTKVANALTSETDPVFSASAAAGITSSDINNWNAKSDFSGSYNDLTNKPTIPTVNNATLTIQKNGSNVQTFTANQATNATANITVPTALSELTQTASYRTVTDTEKTTWNGKLGVDSSSLGKNGYIRYTNGMQICWGIVEDSNRNGVQQYTVTFSKAFYDTNYAMVATAQTTTPDNYYKYVMVNIHKTYNTTTTSKVYVAPTNSSSWFNGIYWIAIGRWK